MRRALPYLLILLIAAAFAGGVQLRGELDLGVSAEAIQQFVIDLGWKGPAIYVGLVTFRTFLLLPSWAVLLAGGVCFGVVWGTLLGGAGILISALYQYALSRSIGREWVRPRMRRTTLGLQQRVERFGSLVVGFSTAHPIGPLTPIHVAAGLSSVPTAPFVIAVAIASPLRSFCWALFGESLLSFGSPRFLAATAVLVVIAVAPLGHPWVRRQLWGSVRPLGDGSAEESP